MKIYVRIVCKFRAFGVTFGTVDTHWFPLPWTLPKGFDAVAGYEHTVWNGRGIVATAKAA